MKGEASNSGAPASRPSRRDLFIGGAAAVGAAAAFGVNGAAAAEQNAAIGGFPNYFKWDAPIFPEIAPKYTMRIAHQNPSNLWVSGDHLMAVITKNIVERSTQGQVRVEIFAGGSLGNQREQLEQTRDGIIQGCMQEAGVPNIYKPIQVFSIPYAFPTHSVAWRVIDGSFGQSLFADMKDKSGLAVIGVGENGGFRCFTNSKHPIHTPADLQGLKIRTEEHPGRIAMVQALGAAATPIPFLELYSSLQTGVVDGQENALPTINVVKLNEVQSYLTFDNHIYGASYYMVNAAWLAGLPPEYQAIVQEAGRQASVASRGLARSLEWELLAQFSSSFKEIYFPTADELKMFKDLAQPAYLTWYKQEVDPEEKWSTAMFESIKSYS
jgi:tripartite ATP-independent transporter DctP family solute receptor